MGGSRGPSERGVELEAGGLADEEGDDVVDDDDEAAEAAATAASSELVPPAARLFNDMVRIDEV